MSPLLTDLAPQEAWDAALDEGLVREGLSEDGRVAVLNYVTAKVQFAKLWTPVTEAARGLVIDKATGEVLARPFRKFFGWSELSPEVKAAYLARREPVLVTDKLDGSLAILYQDPATGEERITTRGSLQGKHSREATALYQRLYAGKWTPDPEYTYLFEALLPNGENVIRYPREELVLIGKVHKTTGRSVRVDTVAEWPWTVTEVMPYGSLQEVLDAPARPHREGVVVHFLESDDRLKVKYEEFVRLHRIGKGVDRHRVWEALKAGVDLEAWKSHLQEEFYFFVDAEAATLRAAHEKIVAEAEEAYASTKAKFGEDYSRKDFALHVNSTYRKPVAAYVLNREFRPGTTAASAAQQLWDQVEPPRGK